jgi:hypothetical protein
MSNGYDRSSSLIEWQLESESGAVVLLLTLAGGINATDPSGFVSTQATGTIDVRDSFFV